MQIDFSGKEENNLFNVNVQNVNNQKLFKLVNIKNNKKLLEIANLINKKIKLDYQLNNKLMKDKIKNEFNFKKKSNSTCNTNFVR